MVRLIFYQIALLLFLSMLYLSIKAQEQKVTPVNTILEPGIITVEELPPIRAENE